MIDQQCITNMRNLHQDLSELIDAYDLLEEILVHVNPYDRYGSFDSMDEGLRDRIRNFMHFDDSE